ncbi:hypothetical protein [Microbacterium sp. SD291]|uniref:hypothetical protein n=1 Tax=Microbacterium sp. SD291 TaxID=2782007 RepID=UPI001A968C77|nr:hypothetical protein [Microbacterium sp. SD291]MBO0980163.1 hypothetical protein [Microbacterium sp. SD291]
MSDITVALNERVVKALFASARDRFSFAKSDSADYGPFSAGYDIALHLERGEVDLRPGVVHVEELDVVWDTLDAWVGIDIPTIALIPRICLLWVPIKGCVWSIGPVTLFEDDPDIKPTIDLSFLVSEVTFDARPDLRFTPNPARPAGVSDLTAHEGGTPHHWELYLDPDAVDLDIVDIADTVGDLLEDAIVGALEALLSPLPDWLVDLLLAPFGALIDIVRWALDLPDDIGEWLLDILGTDFDLWKIVAGAIADAIASEFPLYAVETPYPVQKAEGALLPVLVPIDALDVGIDDTELTLTADFGA